MRIGTATLQERTGQPRGEGRFTRAGAMSAGDEPIGEPFQAVVLRWEDDQAPGADVGRAIATAQEERR